MRLNYLKNLNFLKIYYINFLQYIFCIVILFDIIENLRILMLIFNVFVEKVKFYYILYIIVK